MRKKFGDILYHLRGRGNVKFKTIHSGLCSETTFRKAESGERTIDYMLYNALIQRLGFSANKIESILTMEEYILMKERYLIKKAFAMEDFDQVEKRIQSYRTNMTTKLSYHLHEQYLLKYEAMILHIKHKDYRQSYQLLKQALSLTIRDFETHALHDLYLCREELDLFFRMAISLIRQDQLIQAKDILIQLIDYLEQFVSDEEEQLVLYPLILYQTILLLCNMDNENTLMHQANLSHALLYCNKGIHLLQANKILYLQSELLTCREDILKKLQNIYGFQPTKEGKERYSLLQKHLNDVYEIIEEHGGNYRFYQKIEAHIDTMKLVDLRPDQNIQVMGKLLQRKRKALHITQEKLCENIIDPKNMSRIESSKHVPKETTWHSLMQRLGVIQLSSYYPEIATTDPEIWFKKREISKSLGNKDLKKAKALLEEIETSLEKEDGQNIAKNEQYLSYMHSIVDQRSGRISLNQTLQQMEEALKITIPEYDNISISKWPLTKDETIILNNIGILYTKLGDRKKAIKLWTDIKKSFEYTIEENSEEHMYLWHSSSYLLILCNLANSLDGESSEYDLAITISNLGMKLCSYIGSDPLFIHFLYSKIWSIEQLVKGKKLEKDSLIACHKYCKQAISFSIMIGDQHMKEHLEEHLNSIVYNMQSISNS